MMRLIEFAVLVSLLNALVPPSSDQQAADIAHANTTLVLMSSGQIYAPAQMSGRLVVTHDIPLTVSTVGSPQLIDASVEIIRGVTTPVEAASALCADIQRKLREVGSSARATFGDNTVFVMGGAWTPYRIGRAGATEHAAGESFVRYISWN